MHIKAFSINNSTQCYVTCLPLIDILDRMMVDEWSVQNRFGYQRPIDSRRFGEGQLSIQKIIENGYSTPSNIVINTREKLVYQEEIRQGSISHGFLEIPDHVNFWVIDGRHKLESYRRLSKNDNSYLRTSLCITIYDSGDIGFETGLFFTLNTSSLPLAHGIEYRNIQNLGRHYGEKYLLEHFDLNSVYIYRAIEFVELLNDNEDSPFRGRISFFGNEFRKEHLVRDVDFIPMIKRILKMRILESNLDSVLLSIIKYWNVIKEMYFDCYENNDRYALFGYSGLYVFNMLFLDVEKKISDSSEENYRRILYKLNTITEKHPQLLFKNPMNPSQWDVTIDNNLFITKNPQILNFIYNNLKNKLDL